ncbi:hypothetical protein D9758_004422 [Tetrapyrgos nigripes]|uniref:DUF6534 domain-containing protein n=1 Tax=Tetrapyrgos nigripes TaxID=182062 RepID=A0A8H5GMY0_9AGAR|nr:hypothetical protein D9758_004422 [Tetrapyrgos nigripes]
MSKPDGFLSTSTSIPLGVDISNPFNEIFAGVILSCICVGIIFAQTWTYIFNNQDVWMLRTLVLQDYLVANFGNLFLLNQLSIGTVIGQTVSSISIFCVHCFFMTRVWLVGRFRWILLPIGVLATAALVAGFVIAAHASVRKSFDLFQDSTFKLQFGIETCCAAVADVLVTFQLCYHFFQFRTGIQKTDKLIQKVIQAMVTRGVLVTMGQICLIATYYAGTNKLYWIPFYFNMSKIYAITMYNPLTPLLVAILNSRGRFRRIAGDVTDGSFSFVMTSIIQTHQSENTFSFSQPESRNITENEDHRHGQQKVQVLLIAPEVHDHC